MLELHGQAKGEPFPAFGKKVVKGMRMYAVLEGHRAWAWERKEEMRLREEMGHR